MKKQIIPTILLLAVFGLSTCSTTPADTQILGDKPKMRRLHSGSGEVWGGSGSITGSGSRMRPKPAVSQEDQAMIQKMFEARRSGDTETAEALLKELKKKFPTVNFDRKGQRSGSGSVAPKLPVTQ